MSFLGRALPLVLLALAAGCSSQTADDGASASESNLDQGDRPPADGPLAPDATFGTNGALTLTGPSSAISAAKRADGSIGVLGNKGSAASLTIIKADGSAQVDVSLDGAHEMSGRVLTHKDGLLVVGSNGRYFVARVGADGAIDHSFTADPLDLVANDAAVTKDGKVVVAGAFGARAAIVRLNANGTLDASFGEQGVWLASDDRAAVSKLALGADDSIYALTTGAEKNQLAHFSASGKADMKFGTSGLAAVPAGASSALVMTDSGLQYIGAGSDSKPHTFKIDPAGAVTEGDAFEGTMIGFGTTGLVSAVTDGAACTVHVTEKATASLSAEECASVSYIALGGGKRALVSNTSGGVSVRVFSN